MSFVPALPSPARSGHIDDPRLEMLLGGGVAAAFFIGFVGWAALAPLDAASVATGTVMVSGHRQALQAPAGGVVSAIYVKEGDQVQAGQVLVEFASTEALANERALATRTLTLKAELARLEAERMRRPSVPVPAEFSKLSGEDREIAMRALAMEQSQLIAQHNDDGARRAVLRTRMAEVDHQVDGYELQLEANRRQQALNEKELIGARTLAAKGYAPQTRVNALERSAASLEGDAGSQTAEVSRLHTVAGETRLQIVQGDSARAQQVAEDMRKAQNDLQQVEPQWRAAKDELARTQLRAPVSGAVVGLKLNTIGGVAARGDDLLEIVPKDVGLVVEARLSPKDIADVRTGQTPQVKFLGLRSRATPVLHGSIRRLSADSMVDQRTGAAYYTAEVVVAAAELSRLPKGDGETIKPGMPAQVTIPLRKRSALEFWFEPLTQSFAGALHER